MSLADPDDLFLDLLLALRLQPVVILQVGDARPGPEMGDGLQARILWSELFFKSRAVHALSLNPHHPRLFHAEVCGGASA